MKQNGFTLIELMATVTVLVILSMTVLSVLSRSLSSTARVDNQRLLDENAKSVVNSLSKFLREGELVSVGSFSRSDCTSSGVSGTAMAFKALDGFTSTIAISDDGLASNSAVLHSASITASNLSITWRCSRGLPDQLDLSFSLKPKNLTGDADAGLLSGKSYSFTVVMRNIVE